MAEMASMYVCKRDDAFTLIPYCEYYVTMYTISWPSLSSVCSFGSSFRWLFNRHWLHRPITQGTGLAFVQTSTESMWPHNTSCNFQTTELLLWLSR